MKTKVYHAETLKPGFYYHLDINLNMTRCFYLSGSKKGNKWIYFGDSDDQQYEFRGVKDPEWVALMWTCIPKAEELNELEYYKQNPTDYEL